MKKKNVIISNDMNQSTARLAHMYIFSFVSLFSYSAFFAVDIAIMYCLLKKKVLSTIILKGTVKCMKKSKLTFDGWLESKVPSALHK